MKSRFYIIGLAFMVVAVFNLGPLIDEKLLGIVPPKEIVDNFRWYIHKCVYVFAGVISSIIMDLAFVKFKR